MIQIAQLLAFGVESLMNSSSGAIEHYRVNPRQFRRRLPCWPQVIKILWQARLQIGGNTALAADPLAVAVTVIVLVVAVSVASDGGINARANDTNSSVDRPFENTASVR